MNGELALRDFFIQPGFVCVPAASTRLCAVVSSGVAITLYDKKLQTGGMSHYVFPYRRGAESTATYAAPAIVSLVDLLIGRGSKKEDLEAQLFGGAMNQESDRFVEELAEENVNVGLEILDKLGIPVASTDIGGTRGRKLIFYPESGEVVVAKVDRIRESDWYPLLIV